jgi:hypothetical protein
MAQVGPLRECQDIMDPASACPVSILSPIRRKLRFACASGKRCVKPSQWWLASEPVEFYSNFPALFVRRSFFSLLGAVPGSLGSADPLLL